MFDASVHNKASAHAWLETQALQPKDLLIVLNKTDPLDAPLPDDGVVCCRSLSVKKQGHKRYGRA